MKNLTAQQLAFILDIKKEDARAMMCNAWTKHDGLEKIGQLKSIPKTKRGKGNKIEDPFPIDMPIWLLAKELNLPHLQTACDDIEQNYLTRNASKKYILWDYPEKAIKKFETDNKTKPYRLDLNPALKSMLPIPIQNEIFASWKKYHELNLTVDEYKELHP